MPFHHRNSENLNEENSNIQTLTWVGILNQKRTDVYQIGGGNKRGNKL